MYRQYGDLIGRLQYADERKRTGVRWPRNNNRLTELERKVLEAMRQGLYEVEIAGELDCSVEAVHRSIKRILHLLGSGSVIVASS